MPSQIVISEDGSHTLFVPELNEHYHSIHGAIQESRHVLIEAGLNAIEDTGSKIKILEIGFGTGLNAYLTLVASINLSFQIDYAAIELNPLPFETAELLNYPKLISTKDPDAFKSIHAAKWNEKVDISTNFTIHKVLGSLLEVVLELDFKLIYFDAFAPEKQPELWTLEVFQKMYNSLKSGGILVTYCAKGQVRRNMQAAGFKVARLPGPPFKREMLRATK
jgi:tRNA U34 5-methylaminomethyl-2-thiouridine-forming methyltransferase MnmC